MLQYLVHIVTIRLKKSCMNFHVAVEQQTTVQILTRTRDHTVAEAARAGWEIKLYRDVYCCFGRLLFFHITYLLTYLLTHSLHAAQSFLRS